MVEIILPEMDESWRYRPQTWLTSLTIRSSMRSSLDRIGNHYLQGGTEVESVPIDSEDKNVLCSRVHGCLYDKDPVWSYDLANRVYHIYTKNKYNLFLSALKCCEDPILRPFADFFMSLNSYNEYMVFAKKNANPNYTVSNMVYHGLYDKDYSVKVKRFREFNLFKYLECQPYYDEFEEDELVEHLENVSELPDPQWFPNWTREESDLEYFLRPLSPFSDEIIDEFNEVAISLLSGLNFKVLEPQEILYKMSATRDANLESNWNLKKCPKFSNTIGSIRRCQVFIGPQNYREAVAYTHESLLTFTLISEQCLEVLRNFEEDLIHLKIRGKRWDKKTKNLLKNNSYYIMRDFKKFGLTTPRFWFSRILKILNELYPEVPAFQYCNFFDEATLKEYTKKSMSILGTPCGPGLGFHGSLGSIFQIILLRIIGKRIIQQDSDCKISFLVYNDDMVVASPHDHVVEAFFEVDSQIERDYQVLYSRKKTVWSQSGFKICECYYTKFENKFDWQHVNAYRRFNQIFTACNITHAKAICNSLPDKAWVYGRDQITRFWGFEFDSEEANYPYCLGGWHTKHTHGYKNDWEYLTKQLPYNQLRSYRAVHTDISIIKKYRTTSFVPPWEYFGYTIPDNSNLYVDYRKMETLMLRRRFNAHLTERYWYRLFKMRNKIYHDRCIIPQFELLKTWTEYDLPIPPFIKTVKHPREQISGPIIDLYRRTETPMMSRLAIYNRVPGIKAMPILEWNFPEDEFYLSSFSYNNALLDNVWPNPVRAHNYMEKTSKYVIPNNPSNWFVALKRETLSKFLSLKDSTELSKILLSISSFKKDEDEIDTEEPTEINKVVNFDIIPEKYHDALRAEGFIHNNGLEIIDEGQSTDDEKVDNPQMIFKDDVQENRALHGQAPLEITEETSMEDEETSILNYEDFKSHWLSDSDLLSNFRLWIQLRVVVDPEEDKKQILAYWPNLGQHLLTFRDEPEESSDEPDEEVVDFEQLFKGATNVPEGFFD